MALTSLCTLLYQRKLWEFPSGHEIICRNMSRLVATTWYYYSRVEPLSSALGTPSAGPNGPDIRPNFCKHLFFLMRRVRIPKWYSFSTTLNINHNDDRHGSLEQDVKVWSFQVRATED